MGKSILIYGASFILSIYFAWIYQSSKVAKNKFLTTKSVNVVKALKTLNYFLIIIFPVLIATIRYYVGTDYENYLIYYKKFNDVNIMHLPKPSMEPLYALLNFVTNKLFLGQEFGLFFTTSLLIALLLVSALNYYKDKVTLPFGLFIFYMSYYITSLNIIRQMIAVLIILNAFHFILKEEYLKYILMVLLASLFHNSALMCLAFVLLDFEGKPYATLKKKVLFIIVLLSPIVIPIMFEFSEYIPLLNSYMIRYPSTFNGYGIGFMIDLVFLLGPVLLFRKELINENPKYDFFINLAFISIPIRLMAYHIALASRLFFYISISEVITIPLVIPLIKNKKHQTCFKVIVVIAYSIFFVYKFLVHNSGEGFPYKSIIG